MQQICDPIDFLDSVKARSDLDSPSLQRFMVDVDNWIRYLSADDASPKHFLELIHNMLAHLRYQPMLLNGANSLIRPRYRLECFTTVTVVDYYVLVEEGKGCWICSFSTADRKVPLSDTDVRMLIESKANYERVFNNNTSEEWRACLAQVIQEISDDQCTTPIHRSLARKCLIRLGKQCIVPPSTFLHFSAVGGLQPACYAAKAKYIASGGSHDVFRLDIEGVPTCLRVLRQTERSDRCKLYQDFCTEVNVWRQLKHPNILEFTGVTLELFPKRLCFVLPWLNHGSIMSYLQQHPDHDRFKSICEIANAIEYLHGLEPPVSHKDIKGANVLVRDDLVCVLTDFGLSAILDSQRSKSSGSKGTIYWMAPELFHSETPLASDARPRDIYSLGCTIYEIYTGKSPSTVMMKVLAKEKPKLPPSGDWTPEELELWWIVGLCLQRNPADRPDINLVRQALKDIRDWTPTCSRPSRTQIFRTKMGTNFVNITQTRFQEWTKREVPLYVHGSNPHLTGNPPPTPPLTPPSALALP